MLGGIDVSTNEHRGLKIVKTRRAGGGLIISFSIYIYLYDFIGLAYLHLGTTLLGAPMLAGCCWVCVVLPC